MEKEDVKISGTPPGVPSIIAQPATSAEAMPSCQWFLGEKAFCDKIKKEVRCDGNVKKCPF